MLRFRLRIHLCCNEMVSRWRVHLAVSQFRDIPVRKTPRTYAIYVYHERGVLYLSAVSLHSARENDGEIRSDIIRRVKVGSFKKVHTLLSENWV